MKEYKFIKIPLEERIKNLENLVYYSVLTFILYSLFLSIIKTTWQTSLEKTILFVLTFIFAALTAASFGAMLLYLMGSIISAIDRQFHFFIKIAPRFIPFLSWIKKEIVKILIFIYVLTTSIYLIKNWDLLYFIIFLGAFITFLIPIIKKKRK